MADFPPGGRSHGVAYTTAGAAPVLAHDSHTKETTAFRPHT